MLTDKASVEGQITVKDIISVIFKPDTLIGRCIVSVVRLKDNPDTRKKLDVMINDHMEVFPMGLMLKKYQSKKKIWNKIFKGQSGGPLPAVHAKDTGRMVSMKNLVQYAPTNSSKKEKKAKKLQNLKQYKNKPVP